MSSTTPYRIGATIAVNHSYFGKGQCGLRIVSSTESELTLRKWGILLKKQSNTSWLLLKQVAKLLDIDELDDEVIRLNLHPQAASFYLFTQSIEAEASGWQLLPVKQYGIYAQLQVKISHILQQENGLVSIECNSKEKQWEIICISKYSSSISELKLVEDKNKLLFELAEKRTIPGETSTAFRFISTQAIPLKSSYSYSIRLWEVKRTGMRLLCSSIPTPQPTATSILNANMITTYLYF